MAECLNIYILYTLADIGLRVCSGEISLFLLIVTNLLWGCFIEGGCFLGATVERVVLYKRCAALYLIFVFIEFITRVYPLIYLNLN